MKIQLHEISIREITTGYIDSQEEGVIGYGGKLNIRPKYQREFVYKDTQKWKPIISLHGTKVDEPILVTVKCYVEKIIDERVGNKI